jgi:DNA-binding CsgD family transcriptional regulator
MTAPEAHRRARGRIEHAADSATTVPGLFRGVAEAVRSAISAEGWCGHTLDPATSMPTGGDAHNGYRADLVLRLLEIEYVDGDVNPFNELLHREEPARSIHDATGHVPQRSARYREVVTPSGFEHELRGVFRHQGRPWGALVLMRMPDQPAFTAADSALLAQVSTVLAESMKRVLLRGQVDGGGVPEHAGLLVLDSAGSIETVTPAAEHWLAELNDHDGPVPMTVVALAATAAERGGTSVRTRARCASGTWVTLTAWSLGDRVAISMESSAPHDLTALALAAYSLSERERAVVELVLLGHSTSQIGQRLHLSPYTVQDHLKVVFDKTGVRSRRELAADLFFKHYLPRIERGSELTADGWFQDSR